MVNWGHAMNTKIQWVVAVGLVVGASFSPARSDTKPVSPEQSGKASPNTPAAATKAATIEELKTQLKDKSPSVRRLAAQQLGGRGVRAMDAVPALIEALNDTEPVVRNGAAEALGGIGITARSAVPALIQRLKDSDANVRETAAESLSDIGVDAPKVIPELLKLLSDEDMNVRCAGARAIGDFRGAAREAVEALKKLQKQDKHPLVREAAGEALETIQRAMQRLDS